MNVNKSWSSFFNANRVRWANSNYLVANFLQCMSENWLAVGEVTSGGLAIRLTRLQPRARKC